MNKLLKDFNSWAKSIDLKKKILLALPFILFFFLGNKMAYLYDNSTKRNAIAKATEVLLKTNELTSYPLVSFNLRHLLVGIGLSGLIYMVIFNKRRKKTLLDKEYGSAAWANEKVARNYMDNKNFDNNIILTQTEGLTLFKPSSFKYERNKNVLVVGGSGSGKTRFFIKPNLMQMHSSYIITDPKGTIVEECGQLLRRNGYKIKILNLIDFKRSLRYNPFKYIRSEADILKLANTIILNTKAEGKSAGGDEFWENAEKLYYCALIGYIMSELPESDQNINSLVKLVNSSEVREDDDEFMNKVDWLFYELEFGVKRILDDEGKPIEGQERINNYLINEYPEFANEINVGIYDNIPDISVKNDCLISYYDENGLKLKAQPESFAVRQYKKYKLAAGKTAKSILISCGARLAVFDIEEVRDLLSYDELELEKLGGYYETITVKSTEVKKDDQILKKFKNGTVEVKRLNKDKIALFVIIPDTDSTFNFIVSIMYTQLFNLLCTIADTEHRGKLPVHVRCLLDEFANIGKIPQFEKLIATIRSRQISACIVLQSRAQLQALYKDHAETIIGNCDSELFLGGKEEKTLKSLSEMLGKQTIYLTNTSETRSQQNSFGKNEQKVGRELMQASELSQLENQKCILQIRGEKPFLSNKFDITKHKQYKYLSDFNPKFHFDVRKYIQNYNKIIGKEINLKKDDEVLVIE